MLARLVNGESEESPRATEILESYERDASAPQELRDEVSLFLKGE